MKILHLFPSNRFSGAEHVVCDIIELFRNARDIHMLLVCTQGSIENYLRENEIPYVAMDAFRVANIQKVVREYAPDIIHAHDFRASVLASRIGGVRLISHLHNNPPWIKWPSPQSLAFAMCIGRYERIIGVSSAIKEEYIFKALMAKKFSVLPNAINRNKILSKSQQYDAEGADILFVGRLSTPKNPLAFLSVLKALSDTGIDFHAVMLGEGELRPQCEAFIQDNGLESRVVLKGFVENPYPYMKSAKMLLMPSDWEGFGLVAVEAMLLETPIVCSGAGGLADIVDNDCGRVCHSIADYAKEVRLLLQNDEERLKLARASAIRAERFANLESYREKLLAFYQGVE